MSKKKQKKEKGKKPEKEAAKNSIEISHVASDVKTFIKKFRADVNKKREAYQRYTQKLQKKKS